MNDADRVDGLLSDLDENLKIAASLVARGHGQYDSDPAVRLAFEALSNRVGDLCKRLVAAAPDRFASPIWSLAAKHRDFVVHHYQRVDYEALWMTATTSFPRLHELTRAERKR